ncbi:hypothetical protein IFR05_013878 [Cadophora sp. M221]|nr:hypothetical protein IFR05_013878 [Cadophora sp. M221]
MSKDKTKVRWLEESNFESVQGVLDATIQERTVYELRIEDSPIRQSLGRLSERLLFYGNIMDVLIQQHPEYVALVWGAMRFLVVGVANQQKLISRLSNGLCQIAEVLPRAELILRLYPIPTVQGLISRIFSHLVHAVTRPAELRFDDLIEDIRLLSRNMTDLALASGHAEQRDMHTSQKQSSSTQREMRKKVDHLINLVEQLRELHITDQAINATARIQLHQEISSIQLFQLMTLLSNSNTNNNLLNPIKSLQTALFMRNRRRDFCAGSVLLLQQKRTPVIWAVKALESYASTEIDSMTENMTEGMTSTIDLLKYLVLQAVQLNTTIHTDATMTPKLNSYWGARTEADWFNVLASIIQGIPLLYIIIDVELLHPSLPVIAHGFTWPAAFRELFTGLSERNVNTVLTVALVSYGSPVMALMDRECRNATIAVGASRRVRGGPEKAGRKVRKRRGENGRGCKAKICFR